MHRTKSLTLPRPQWLGKHAIRDPPIGVPGERTAGCKYYCDRQTARHESKW